MITTERELNATREALTHAENALAGHVQNRVKFHPKTFDLLADPIVEDIRKYRAEIDAYIGLDQFPLTGSAEPLPEERPQAQPAGAA